MKPIDPRNHIFDDLDAFRAFLKNELLERRHYQSDLSGKWLYGGCEMHEGILTRANVPRGIWWHYMIFHEFNCFLLLPEEHRPFPPSREWCIEKAYERYGREAVKAWYYSLPFKSFPFQLP